MKTINFQLVTPERTLLSQELASLSCPTTTGEITILPGHIPLVTTLAPGELRARTESDEFFIYVSGGFVEVRPNSEVIVLADAAEHHYEIDVKAAEEARTRARAALAESKLTEAEHAQVSAALQRSLVRINVARKRANRRAPITSGGVITE